MRNRFLIVFRERFRTINHNLTTIFKKPTISVDIAGFLKTVDKI